MSSGSVRQLQTRSSTIFRLTAGFSPLGRAILPGQSSDILIIDTPATTATAVTAAVQDGTNDSLASYAVYAPGGLLTPEPSSVVMMAMGLIGLFAVVRGRGRRASV